MSATHASRPSVPDRAALVAAIDDVVDPCSQAIGVPLGLGEMGLVELVEGGATSGRVRARLRLTSPCCAYGPLLARALEARLMVVTGVTAVTVDVDHAAMWSPADIEPSAAARLDERRRRTLALTDTTPHAWPERSA